MPAVTYFVRMVAKAGRAEEVRETLQTNPAKAGEFGMADLLAFAVAP